MEISDPVRQLIARGVKILDPNTVSVGASVLPERIGEEVTLHPGARLDGERLSIGPGSVIGEEGPATVVDCQVGSRVRLKGGYFETSVFLDGASAGSGAHVRAGSILEESSSFAHSVGLKQTILMPYVTLGSLINFCDCLMAGGRGPKDHSEVGSSYVHFNFTPQGDKATASLIGDVPRGVMLDQDPIFLGGQGGMVGPRRVEYGVVTAAGVILRKDVWEPARLILPHTKLSEASLPYTQGRYGDVTKTVQNCVEYIANLHALRLWYRHARTPLLRATPQGTACLEGARDCIRICMQERMARLADLAQRVERSIKGGAEGIAARSQAKFTAEWPRVKPALEEALQGEAGERDREEFLRGLAAGTGKSYTEAIQGLSAETKATGVRWLRAEVERVVEVAKALWAEGN